jgi:hypothetical protein
VPREGGRKQAKAGGCPRAREVHSGEAGGTHADSFSKDAASAMVPATAELLPRFLKKYKKSKLKCDETETVQVGGVSWGGVRRRRGHRAGTTGRLVRSRR